MFSPAINPLTLSSLHLAALGRAFLRLRNPRRQRAGRHREAFYRQVWQDAAANLGAACQELGSDILQISLDGAQTRVTGNITAIDDPVTLMVLHDKPLTHRILQDAGIPVPPHATFSLRNMQPALAFLRDHAASDCVVKPAGGTGGGRGVTTGIRRTFQLARAAAAAAVYNDQLLIEQQIDGENYRLLYLDGQLIDAFVRRHPSVLGDGVSSVSRLVDAHNQQRLQRGSEVSQGLLTIDLDMRRTLARQRLSLRSVPAKGARVILKTVVNENSGADNTTATSLLCPDLVAQGAQAVRALGVRFAGIDIVTPDPGRGLAQAGGVVLEVNGTPNLYYHYKKDDGPFPVADLLLRQLLRPKPRASVRPPARAAALAAIGGENA